MHHTRPTSWLCWMIDSPSPSSVLCRPGYTMFQMLLGFDMLWIHVRWAPILRIAHARKSIILWNSVNNCCNIETDDSLWYLSISSFIWVMVAHLKNNTWWLHESHVINFRQNWGYRLLSITDTDELKDKGHSKFGSNQLTNRCRHEQCWFSSSQRNSKWAQYVYLTFLRCSSSKGFHNLSIIYE